MAKKDTSLNLNKRLKKRIDPSVLKRGARGRKRELTDADVEKINSSQASRIDAAVKYQLGRVVKWTIELGFEKLEGKYAPHFELDENTLKAIAVGEKLTGLSKAQLVRLCLCQIHKSGLRTSIRSKDSDPDWFQKAVDGELD